MDLANLAYGYLRTSSATNIGDGKDSEPRQQRAIERFAQERGYRIAGWFRDPAVSGADPVKERPGFAAMIDAIAQDGVRCVLVESPDRFARNLYVSLVGHNFLRQHGIELVPVSAPDHFLKDDPVAVLFRHLLAALAEFDKANIVLKLKAARDRKRAETGKCEGGKNHEELNPAMVAFARQLRRKRVHHGGTGKLRPMPLAAISRELAERGWINANGRPYALKSVRSMLLLSAPSATRTALLNVIGRLDFVVARTMPQLPHEYSTRAKAVDDADYIALFDTIMGDGVIEWWRSDLTKRWKPARYLYIDGWRYWSMSAFRSDKDGQHPLSISRHINRQRLAETARLIEAGLIATEKPERPARRAAG